MHPTTYAFLSGVIVGLLISLIILVTVAWL
jgi:hypothetical protein